MAPGVSSSNRPFIPAPYHYGQPEARDLYSEPVPTDQGDILTRVDAWVKQAPLGEKRNLFRDAVLKFLNGQSNELICTYADLSSLPDIFNGPFNRLVRLDLSNNLLSVLPPTLLCLPLQLRLTSLNLVNNRSLPRYLHIKIMEQSDKILDYLAFYIKERNLIIIPQDINICNSFNCIPCKSFLYPIKSFTWKNITLNEEEVNEIIKYLKLAEVSGLCMPLQWSHNDTFDFSYFQNIVHRIRNAPLKLENFQVSENSNSKSSHVFECLGETRVSEHEKIYLFKVWEKYTKERCCYLDTTDETFPANEIIHPNMVFASTHFQAFYEMGWRMDPYVVDRNGSKISGAYFAVPGPDALLSMTNNFIKQSPTINRYIPCVTIKLVDGIASDLEYINSHLEALYVISPTEEFVHDVTAHVFPEITDMLDDPRAFAEKIKTFNNAISIVKDRILQIKDNPFPNEMWNKEEIEIIKEQIDECTTLLAICIDLVGKSRGSSCRMLLGELDRFFTNPNWVKYMKSRYSYKKEFSVERALKAFNLLIKGLID